VRPAQVNHSGDLLSKITRAKWTGGQPRTGKVPVLQAGNPELKLQSHKKKKKGTPLGGEFSIIKIYTYSRSLKMDGAGCLCEFGWFFFYKFLWRDYMNQTRK
jgi:hypothetical protein